MSHFPKIIHQTWKTKDIPEALRFCTDSWKKLNPDWEYILWTDEDMDIFVGKYYPQIHGFYRAYPHNIFRADLFRLLVVHHMGGIYADLDMECLKSLDSLLSQYVNIDEAEVVLSYEPPVQSKPINLERMYQAIFLAGKPGGRILDTLIQDCLGKGTGHQLKDVIFVTGPVALTGTLNKILPDKRVCVLDYKIVNPVVDISHEALLRSQKRSSYEMLLKKEFYPETCMVHYWHHAYWDRKPMLAWSREELEREFIKSKSLLYDIKDRLYRAGAKSYYAVRKLLKPPSTPK